MSGWVFCGDKVLVGVGRVIGFMYGVVVVWNVKSVG